MTTKPVRNLVIGSGVAGSVPDTELPHAPALAPARADDFLQLVRPRLIALVLVTVAAGGLLAARTADWMRLVHAVIGTALVAAGASCLNQLLEQHTDARMPRTADRPLPAGRLLPEEVLALGGGLALGGFLYLLLALPQPTAALLAALAFVSYLAVYTPLKRRTTLNTLVGAVPGALPPVIGWVAVRGRLDAGAVSLFLIVFLWKVPHFLAIAWMYRDQYARAGLRVLPVGDPRGTRTARQMVLYTLALIPVSLLPAVLGMVGPAAAAVTVALGGLFAFTAARFAAERTDAWARRMMRASLVYLPVLLLVLVVG
jgi:protoheme IX farnesyltransferase